MGRKPSHAVEGAVAVAPLLAAVVEECEPLFNAAFTAIVRHHGAFTSQGHTYQLTAGAQEAIWETLAVLPARVAQCIKTVQIWNAHNPTQEVIADMLVRPERDDEYVAYALLARTVRRADQIGTRG